VSGCVATARGKDHLTGRIGTKRQHLRAFTAQPERFDHLLLRTWKVKEASTSEIEERMIAAGVCTFMDHAKVTVHSNFLPKLEIFEEFHFPPAQKVRTYSLSTGQTHHVGQIEPPFCEVSNSQFGTILLFAIPFIASV